MSELINRLDGLVEMMEKTKETAKQGCKDKTLYNITADIRILKGIIDNARQANEAKDPDSNCAMHVVGRSFSRSEVKNIVLEIENAAKYAHSHKQDRREMISSFCEIRRKWDLFG